MSANYIDGVTTIARVDGPKRYLAPIENVRANLDVFQQDYLQIKSAFSPRALGSSDSANPGYYLVAETAPTEIGGGIIKWTRTYSKIPALHYRYESYGWLVPGIGSEAVYADVSIASYTGGAPATLVTSTSSTATVGDTVSVSYTFTDTTTGTSYGRRTRRTCLTGTSGTTLKVDNIWEPGGTITFNTLRKVEPGRNPETVEVQSLVALDYWLPGVSAGITTPMDIPVIDAYEIYDGDGRKTNTFESDSDPSVSDWRTSVANREIIVAVASIVRPWLGPIYQRATRYVVAQ